MILDTSYLIDLFDGRAAAFERGLELTDGAEFGNEDERRNVRNALGMFPVVHQDGTIARLAGQLLARAGMAAAGERGIDNVDSMVAAVAERHGEPVLTADVDDFEALGADVEPY